MVKVVRGWCHDNVLRPRTVGTYMQWWVDRTVSPCSQCMCLLVRRPALLIIQVIDDDVIALAHFPQVLPMATNPGRKNLLLLVVAVHNICK